MFTIPKQIVLPVGEYASLSDFLKLSTDSTSAHLVKFLSFKGSGVKDATIYKHLATDPVLASVSISLGAAAESKRFTVDVVLNDRSLSSFARASTINRGKPLTIEYPGGMAPADALLFFNKQIAGSEMAEYLKFVNDTGVIKLQGKKGFIDLVEAKVQKLTDGTYVDSAAAVTSTGAMAFGSYEYIVENLHLPTAANTNPWGEVGWGMPVPGVKYNQYTFSVSTDRGPMGIGAVGQEVTSSLTYCMYVPEVAVFAGLDVELAKIIVSKGATAAEDVKLKVVTV